ncbi:MAG TPA: hypothetical protein ENJ00_03840 [Phycisphaerales bacterium]|nr:hypothetical protein [Phycisphaerales bacterium]
MRAPSLILLLLTLSGCASESNPFIASNSPDQRTQSTPLQSRPTLSVVLSTEPWTFGTSTGSIIRTPSYRLFTTTTRPILLSRVPVFLESSLTHYRSAFVQLPPPPIKLDTYLMQTRPEWANLTRLLMQRRAPVYLQIERGGFAAEGRGIYRDLGSLNDTLNIAAHEGWHQYTQLAFRHRLPIALEEGIASYMEGFRWDPNQPEKPIFLPWANPERFDQLRLAADSQALLSLPELLSTTPQQLIAVDQNKALTWYAQVWTLIHFLNEGDQGAHADDLRRLLLDSATGTRNSISRSAGQSLSQAALFTKAFHASPSALDASYQNFIRQITRPGMRSAIIAGRSPLDSSTH